MQLEKSVIHASGGVSEIERCRSRAANTLSDADDILKNRAVDAHELLRAEREARGEECALHFVLCRDAHAAAVAECAGALFSREGQIAKRLEHERADHLVAFAQTDRDRPDRKMLQVV